MSAQDKSTGLAGFALNEHERRYPIWVRFEAALREELATMRVKNDSPADIATTTLLRGEIRCVNRILARATAEVGPESRQSEPDRPESAFVDRPTAAVFPDGY